MYIISMIYLSLRYMYSISVIIDHKNTNKYNFFLTNLAT